MYHLPNLRHKGPICKVLLKASDPTIQKLKVEKKKVVSKHVRALIDTGASATAISRRVAKALKLVARGTVKVYTSSKGFEMRSEYDISMAFDKTTRLTILKVLEANFQDMNIDCLIGRDVLEHAVFAYDGPRKVVTLSF